MSQGDQIARRARAAAEIVGDAGGRVVGRTRLQKIAYLLELSGAGTGFPFAYRHYGPYSEELTLAVRAANRLRLMSEEERATNWGGSFSIFTTEAPHSSSAVPGRIELVREGASAGSIELELAATAAYLYSQGEQDPWKETERRKPDKAKDRLGAAKALYERLRAIELPQPLPEMP